MPKPKFPPEFESQVRRAMDVPAPEVELLFQNYARRDSSRWILAQSGMQKKDLQLPAFVPGNLCIKTVGEIMACRIPHSIPQTAGSAAFAIANGSGY